MCISNSCIMRFGFVTCVQLGLSCMEGLYKAGGALHLIITLPDDKAVKKSGRIYVDDFAAAHKIPVVKANHINDTVVVDAIKEQEIDWLFIIGWSQIASVQVLNAVRQGCIGAHPTLLPQGRGRAPIPWAILKGLYKTGVSFFKLDEGVDTGAIVGVSEIEIKDEETATTLYKEVDQAHSILFNEVYFKLLENRLTFTVQDESMATYWPGRTPQDGLIHMGMSEREVHTLVRATTRPYPGAFLLQEDKKIIVWGGKPYSTKQEIPGAFEIVLQDGFYYATDFEIIQGDSEA